MATISTLTDTTTHPVAFADQIEVLDRDEAPLLKLFGVGKSNLSKLGHVRDWPQTKLQWLNDTNAAFTATTDTSAGTGTSIVLLTGEGQKFRAGDLLYVPTTGEKIIVVSVSSETLTVIRGHGDTSAVSLGAGVAVERRGRAMPEGYTTYATGYNTTTSLEYNYTQIISQAVSVTETERATVALGVKDQLDYQIMKLINNGGSAGELPKSLEDIFYYGERIIRATTGATVAATIGFAGGFDVFVNDTTATTGLVTTDLARSLTVADVWQKLRNVRDRGGRVTHAIMGGQLIEVFNELFPAQDRVQATATGGDMPLETIRTPHGSFSLVYDYRAPSDTVYFVNPKYIGWVPLREFGYKDYKEVGDNCVTDVVGEYTFFVRHGDVTHAKIGGIDF
jgi:hypothetical protein